MKVGIWHLFIKFVYIMTSRQFHRWKLVPYYLTMQSDHHGRNTSQLCAYLLKIHSGSDIVKYLRDFTEKHNLSAAFLIHCVGDICDAKIRLAEATAGFNPVSIVLYRIAL